jgi:site-specific DNA-methyltransferase (adenine-specific)
MSLQPYYQDDWATIYHGDCLQILKSIGIESDYAILTDPVYPDHPEYKYKKTKIDFLDNYSVPQLIFWSAKIDFPLKFDATHIWDKRCGVQSEYERIFERNTGTSRWRMFRYYLINSTVAANYNGEIFTGHKSQKPLKLIEDMLKILKAGMIIDMFSGSGTTLVASKNLGKKSIGIEIEEKYCEIAAKRLSQEVLDLTL